MLTCCELAAFVCARCKERCTSGGGGNKHCTVHSLGTCCRPYSWGKSGIRPQTIDGDTIGRGQTDEDRPFDECEDYCDTLTADIEIEARVRLTNPIEESVICTDYINAQNRLILSILERIL